MVDYLAGGLAASGYAGRDADPIVGGAGDGEAGAGRDGGADPRDPVQVVDVVLRQAAAPPGSPVRVRLRGQPDRLGQLGGGQGGKIVVVALQDRDVTAAADRA